MAMIFGLEEEDYYSGPRRRRRDHAYFSESSTRPDTPLALPISGAVSPMIGPVGNFQIFVRQISSRRSGPIGSCSDMQPKDRAFYDTLPDEIEVWRGWHSGNPVGSLGLSWSTDRAVAVTRGASKVATCEPILFRGTISKTDVALAMTGSEMEIVPFDTGDIRNRTRERLTVDDLKGRQRSAYPSAR